MDTKRGFCPLMRLARRTAESGSSAYRPEGESRKKMSSEPERRWRDIWINLLTYVDLHDADWQSAPNYVSKMNGRYDTVHIRVELAD